MPKQILLNKELTSGVILGVVISIACFLPDYVLPLLVPAVILLLLVNKFGYNGWLFISMILLVSFPDHIGEGFRAGAQALGFILIFGRYLLKEGFKIPEFLIKDRPLQYVLGGICFAVFTATIFSQSVVISIQHFIRLLVFIAFALGFGYHLKDKSIRDTVLWGMYGIGMTGALITIFTFLNNRNEIEMLLTMATVQEGGLYSNRAALGAQILLAIVSGFYMIYTGPQQYKKWIKIGIIILLMGMFLANSRGALIGLTVFSVLFTFLVDRRKFYYILGTVAFLVLIYLLVPPIEFIVTSYFRANRIGENTRYYLWEFVGRIIADYPITGIGPGLVKYSMPKYLNVDLSTFEGAQYLYLFNAAVIGHAHNFYLFTLSETGILGLLAAFTFIGFYLKRAFTLFRVNVSEHRKTMIIGGTTLSIIIGLLCRAMVESTGIITFGWITRDLMFWIWFMLLLNEYYDYKKKTAVCE